MEGEANDGDRTKRNEHEDLNSTDHEKGVMIVSGEVFNEPAAADHPMTVNGTQNEGAVDVSDSDVIDNNGGAGTGNEKNDIETDSHGIILSSGVMSRMVKSNGEITHPISNLLRSQSMPEASGIEGTSISNTLDIDTHDTVEVTTNLDLAKRLPSTSMSTSPHTINYTTEKQTIEQPQHQQQLTSSSEEEDESSLKPLPHTLQSQIAEKSPAERYIRFKEKLGSGAYKDVYRAYDTIEGIEVAWNVVKLNGVPKGERVRIVNEVRLLERLHHPNIISFHGSWVNRETERVIFVTEILSSGTLKSFVQKVQLIRWKIFKRWAIQILKGLEYLHSQDPPIIHRDLKCDNIFINGTSGDLRIGDFGLSTAISKKNQPLSVLGTPEFMAPELYDENYDEKVDIYAFGMLLLEIVTNQVPYHECTNPAQIYKKVTSGIPPVSLRRVKSENARNFILLCLGIEKDASARPSATELLNHFFLSKGADDDDTIEVEPAIEDMVIDEMAPLEVRPGSLRCGKGISLTISDTCSEHSLAPEKTIDPTNPKFSQSIDGQELPIKGVSAAPPTDQDALRDESTVRRKTSEKATTTGDAVRASADDQFGEMPENEANMKRVKVMMGRGTALDDDEPPSQQLGETSLSPPQPAAVPSQHHTSKINVSRSIGEAESSLGSVSQFKVSAVPRPEALSSNDAINLALTLPDENQTTIEFEFDLVNDDPVQVAREMVMELDEVPNDAVLDISEAISGVARHARQQNFLAQKQQQGLLMHPQSGMVQSHGTTSQELIMNQQQQPGIGGQQQLMHGSGYPGIGFQTPAAQMAPSQLGHGNDVISTLHQHHQQAQHLSFMTSGGTNLAGGNDTNTTQNQQQHQSLPPPPPHGGFQTPGGPSIASQTHADHKQQQSISYQTPGATSIPQQNLGTLQQQQSLGFQSPASGMLGQGEPQPYANVPHHLRIGSDLSAHQHQHSNVPFQGSSIPGQLAHNQLQLTTQHLTQQNYQFDTTISQHEIVPFQQEVIIKNGPDLSLQDTSMAYSQDSHSQSASILQQKEFTAAVCHPPHMVVVPESSELEDDIDEGDEADAEEIRKLEEEFEKRLQRAKKSYGTRMDNLHRSKEEAEAQHQMTLEKHEKERIEFEKRVRLAEEEQNRRLSQIEKEFEERKHQVRQHRAFYGIGDKPPLHGGHKRSSSHFDQSVQRPATGTEHRKNSAQYPNISDHRRNHSTQSSGTSASDFSDEQVQVDQSSNASSSGFVSLDENSRQLTSGQSHVRQVEISQTPRDRSDSTSSPA